jgi:hypothetical protein
VFCLLGTVVAGIHSLLQEMAEEVKQRRAIVLQWEAEKQEWATAKGEWEAERQEMIDEMAAEARERHKLLEAQTVEQATHKGERIKLLDQIDSLMRECAPTVRLGWSALAPVTFILLRSDRLNEAEDRLAVVEQSCVLPKTEPQPPTAASLKVAFVPNGDLRWTH